MIYKVLLVEDDKVLSDAIASCVTIHDSSVNFTVDQVYTIKECLEKLATINYDLIMLDLNLSNGKGEFTFLRIYGAANQNIGMENENRTPIIVLTGSTDNYSNLIIKGAMDVIFKPVTIRELHQRMHMSILRFPYKRTKELHDSIENTIKEARDSLGSIQCPETK